MRANGVKDKWAAGEPVVNGWLAIPSGVSAEIMARAGYNSITVDLQHGLIDYQTALALLQSAAQTDATPLARVPWNEPGIIMKLLDAGAYGIICPMVNTKEECERFVGACRYAPAGYRSYGPSRASMYAGAGYAEEANSTLLAIAMIETRQAMDNLDAILSVPGLDGIYIGPSDLGITLGVGPTPDREEGPAFEAIKEILAGAKKHGLKAGIHTQAPEYALKMFDLGFDLATVGMDTNLLRAAANQTVKTMRAGAATPSGEAKSIY